MVALPRLMLSLYPHLLTLQLRNNYCIDHNNQKVRPYLVFSDRELYSKMRQYSSDMHLTMRNVITRRFPLKYKKDGLFCTACDCDRDLLMHTYNHHHDKFDED